MDTDSDRLSRASIARAALHDLADPADPPGGAGTGEDDAPVAQTTPWESLALRVLDQAREAHPDGDTAIAVLVLDRLGQVHRLHGRKGQQVVLDELTRRLGQVLHPGERLHRLEAGRFAVVAVAESDEEAATLAERLGRALGRPIMVGEDTHHLSACVGVARNPEVVGDVATADALLADATMALQHARGRGRGHIAVADEAMRSAAARRLDLEAELVGALGRGELHLVFQPIVDLVTRRAVGAEALLRWAHPRLGAVSPVEFLPVAEAAGLIDAIGMWVVHEALRTAADWPAETYVSVNLSAAQLRVRGVATMVRVALARTGLSPSRLRLELTESVLLEDSAVALRELEALRELGVSIGIDDFGTGYASMSYLKRLTVDFIKVDREFVDGLGGSPVDEAIVRSCLALADALGLESIGEGVERGVHEQGLAELGCTHMQGFGYARPVRAEELDLARTWPTPAED